MADLFEEISNGVVLAELGGYGDGPYCAEYGAGAAMVIMGTYVVDARDEVPYPETFVFKPGRENYASYLAEHVPTARASGAKVAVSIISVELGDSVDFLRAAEEAGADYASLCVHSGMSMFTSVGLGAALCRDTNREHLRKWCTGLSEALNIPLIMKFGMAGVTETVETTKAMIDCGVEGVHVNFGDATSGAGLAAVREVAGACPFLIAGGGIDNVEGARRVLEAGADAVAIADARRRTVRTDSSRTLN